MNAPSKFIVERTGSNTPAVSVHFHGTAVFMTEDTALVLADALKQVAYGEKQRLTVFEETETRPAGLYA
jgi:uncharacterized protein (DUF1786 family)